MKINLNDSNKVRKITDENDLLLNTLNDKKIFVDALLNPPLPNEKLKQAQVTFKNAAKNRIID